MYAAIHIVCIEISRKNFHGSIKSLQKFSSSKLLWFAALTIIITYLHVIVHFFLRIYVYISIYIFIRMCIVETQ